LNLFFNKFSYRTRPKVHEGLLPTSLCKYGDGSVLEGAQGLRERVQSEAEGS